MQVKDGGEGKDSFPSWGLNVQVEKPYILLSRQEYQKSHWLGTMLKKWSGKPFKSIPYTNSRNFLK